LDNLGAALLFGVVAAMEVVFGHLNIALAAMVDGICPFLSTSICDWCIIFSAIKFRTFPWKW